MYAGMIDRKRSGRAYQRALALPAAMVARPRFRFLNVDRPMRLRSAASCTTASTERSERHRHTHTRTEVHDTLSYTHTHTPTQRYMLMFAVTRHCATRQP